MQDGFRPEKSGLVCPILASKLIRIACQPVPLAAIRRYLLHMLRFIDLHKWLFLLVMEREK